MLYSHFCNVMTDPTVSLIHFEFLWSCTKKYLFYWGEKKVFSMIFILNSKKNKNKIIYIYIYIYIYLYIYIYIYIYIYLCVCVCFKKISFNLLIQVSNISMKIYIQIC